MPTIESQVRTNSDDFDAQRQQMLELVDGFRQLEQRVRQTSNSKKAKFAKRNKLLPRERLAALLDDDSPWLEISTLAGLGMQGYFESTRCADETASKPDPRMLSEILRERRRPREQALMVGDSIYDLDMARRLGMASVGISHGVHDHAALGVHAPLAIVDRLSELESVVAGLAQSRTA